MISTLKYIPIEEAENWYYKHSSFDRCHKRPEIKEFNCTKLLVTNPHLPYKKMQKTITNKLAKDPDSISSKDLYKWLISIDDDERFDFLTIIDDIGQKSSHSLVEKMQAVLNGEVLINKTSYSIDIRIPETFPADKVMYFLKKYNFGKFSFPSLKYFDMPLIRDEFCNILLSECNKKNSVTFGINRFWLSLKIEQELEDLSIDFLILLYKLLSRLYQIESLSILTKCQQLIYPKIKDEILVIERSVLAIKKEEAPAIIPEIKECATTEPRPVENNHISKIDSATHSEENNPNKANGGTKRRGLLDIIKSLFKRS